MIETDEIPLLGRALDPDSEETSDSELPQILSQAAPIVQAILPLKSILKKNTKSRPSSSEKSFRPKIQWADDHNQPLHTEEKALDIDRRYHPPSIYGWAQYNDSNPRSRAFIFCIAWIILILILIVGFIAWKGIPPWLPPPHFPKGNGSDGPGGHPHDDPHRHNSH